MAAESSQNALAGSAPSSAEPVLGAPQRVAVFRALQLGDLLCAVPALRALRAGLPDARITLLTLPWARSFAQRFAPYISDVLVFPGAPGLPEQRPDTGALAQFYAAARRRRFDLALQLHGDGRITNTIVRRLGAQQCAGFFPAGSPCPDRQRYVAYPETLHEIERLLSLVAFLGLDALGKELEFPITAAEWRAVGTLLADHGLRHDAYICLHPGARSGARRWPPAAFARVADALAARGLTVVLTGTEGERPLTAAVKEAMNTVPRDLTGKTSLGVLAGLIACARLLICNDTGVSHIAAARKTPSVVIFTASSPQRWAPLDPALHTPVFHPVPCRPCSHAACPIGHLCAASVAPEQVIEAAERLMTNDRNSGLRTNVRRRSD